jgi:hypothetical protein
MEILEDAQSLLAFGQLALCEVEPALDAYGTLVAANRYFDNRLRNQFWKRADTGERKAAMMEATRLIDKLNYLGCKASSDQTKQFPRNGDTVVPLAVEQACYEVALKLLEGFDPEMEMDGAADAGHSFGGVRNTYDRTFLPEHIGAGIPSFNAWTNLKPYLRDPNIFEICRVN